MHWNKCIALPSRWIFTLYQFGKILNDLWDGLQRSEVKKSHFRQNLPFLFNFWHFTNWKKQWNWSVTLLFPWSLTQYHLRKNQNDLWDGLQRSKAKKVIFEKKCHYYAIFLHFINSIGIGTGACHCCVIKLSHNTTLKKIKMVYGMVQM